MYQKYTNEISNKLATTLSYCLQDKKRHTLANDISKHIMHTYVIKQIETAKANDLISYLTIERITTF